MSTNYHGDYSEVETNHINVNDLAEVFGNFKKVKSVLHLVLKAKKSADVKNLIVSLNISQGSTNENQKQIICQDEWTEVKIQRILLGDSRRFKGGCYVIVYTAEINITVHATTPVAPFKSIQLYEDTEFTDFKLRAADGTVAFHKNILCIQSEMFRTMLRGQWKETGEDSINMEGVSLQTLQHLKDFMYLGTIPDEGLEALLLVAKRCLMDNLAAPCIEKLITTVTPETFDGLAEFACQNNIVELVRAFARIPDHVVNGICWY